MKTTKTFLAFIFANACIGLGLFQLNSLQANTYQTPSTAAGSFMTLSAVQTPPADPPVIEIDGHFQSQVFLPHPGDQLLHISNLIPGETYTLSIPVNFATDACLPKLSAENPMEELLSTDTGSETLKFVAKTAETYFHLFYPGNVNSVNPHARHFVNIVCETCLKTNIHDFVESQTGVIQVTPTGNADSLIRNVFIGNSCFDVHNVTQFGQPFQFATFKNGTTNIGIETGLILCTDSATMAIGPNNTTSALLIGKTDAQTNDADLWTLPGTHDTMGFPYGIFDKAVIEFDFTPTENVLKFDYVFATEEHCEWVGSQYNDVFGFFIAPVDTPSLQQNIAVVPGTSTPVSVNTINYQTNKSYYVHNRPESCGTFPGSVPPLTNEIQFDGFTKVLTATANVIPCKTYHIKLKVANISDGWIDAAVFLKAGSFNGGGVAAPQWVVNGKPDSSMTTEGCDAVNLVLKRVGTDTAAIPVALIISGTATPGVDYSTIPNPVIIPKDSMTITVPVTIFTDQVLEGNETITVKLVDSCICTSPQKTLLIKDFTPTISGNLNYCAGGNTTLTASGGVSFLWDDNSTDSVRTVTAGTYTVTVTAANGCTRTAEAIVTGYPLPNVEPITGTLNECTGSTTTLSDATPSGVWASASPGIATVDGSGLVSGISAGTSIISYTVTDGYGCSNAESATVTVNNLPAVAPITGGLSVCTGSAATLSDATPGGVWASASPAIATVDGSGLVSGISAGASIISYTVTDSNGCSNAESTTVTVNTAPTAGISGTLEFCTGANTALTASGGSSYEWSTTETTPSINVSTGGNYTVTVTEANGCTATSSVTVTALGFVVTTLADSGPGSLRQTLECANSHPGPDSISFNLPGDPPYEIILDTPLPEIIESTNIDASTQPGWAYGDIFLKPADPAGFTEGLYFTGSNSGLKGMVIRGFSAGAGVRVNSTSFFTLSECIIDNCQTGVSITGDCNYLIQDNEIANNADKGIDAGAAADVQVRRNTMYCNGANPGGDPFLPASNAKPPPVILTASAIQITGTATYLPPTPNFPDNIVEIFTAGDPFCPDVDVQGKTYLGQAIVNPDGTWTATGAFPTDGLLTATVTNPALCTGPDTCALKAAFNSVVQNVNDVQFTDNSTGGPTSWLWNFGDGATSTDSMPLHTYTSIGSFQVKLKVTRTVNGNVCMDSIIHTINIDCPVNGPSFTTPVTSGLHVEFAGYSPGTPSEWYWTFGDGTDGYGQNISHDYASNGTYDVSLTTTYTENGLFCQDTYYGQVTTNDPCGGLLADFTFQEQQPACIEYAFSDNSSGSPNSWQWDFGDPGSGPNNTASGPNVNHTFSAPLGSFTVTLTISNGIPGCMASISHQIYVDCTTLINDDKLAIGSKKTNNATLPAEDAVTSDFSPAFCLGVVADISGTPNFCTGQSTYLTASPGMSYVWSTTETTEGITVSTPGNYTVTVTFAANCTASATVTVVENSLPVPVISGTLGICAGASTTLSASGGLSYVWSTTDTTADISVNTAGDYTVTVTDGNGCVDATSVSVNVNPLPMAGISGMLTICAGDITTLSASGGASYAWSTTETTADIDVGTAGDYTVTVTDANGCTDETSVTVTVNPLPVVGISGDLEICSGETTILTASGGDTYDWSTTETTQSISVGVAGTYSVIGTDANGCTNSASADVIVDPLPAAGITGIYDICPGTTTTFTASGGVSYAWSTTETTADISVGTAGDYTVTVTDANGCTDATSAALNLYPPAVAGISGTLTICAGDITTLSASGGASYAWSTTETTADIDVGTAGDYTVTITDVNGCTDETSVTVTVNPLPVVDISGDLEICSGETTILTASGGNTYDWSTTETTQSISVGVAGTYSVIATDANGCTSSASADVILDPLPAAGITGIYDICPGTTTTFTASGGVSYAWSTTETTADISVGTAGDYTVTVTDANGCTDATSAALNLYPPAVAGISGMLTICAGDITTLSASGGASYAWSTTETTADIDVGTAGDYTVTVTDANGCTDETSVTVTVNPLPVVGISGDLEICSGETTILTASGGDTYDWSTTEMTQSISVGVAGTYSVIGTAANGCTNSASADVIVDPLPTAGISGVLDICPGTTTTLTASGGDTYEWNTTETTTDIIVGTAGDYTVTVTDANGCTDATSANLNVYPPTPAAISGILGLCPGVTTTLTASGGTSYEWGTTETTPDIMVSTAGDYTVTVTDANGCTAETSVTVTVNAVPAISISGNLNICTGQTTNLTASAGSSYEWSTTETSESIVAAVAGDYTVTVTVANNCTASATVSVVINTLPTAAIAGVLDICPGTTTTFSASGGTSYAWSTTETTPGISVGMAGDYTVTVTDANGCTDVTSATLNLYPPAVAGIAGTLEICSGATSTLTASGGTGYAWSTTETTPDISVNTAGDYTVTVTDANGCADATSVSLIVDPLPTVAISGDLEICSGETSILTASGGTSYAWSTTETTPDISVGTANTYTVLATDVNGCTNSATADLIVDPLPTAAIAGVLDICPGTSSTLTASGGTNYAWSTTETTPDISVGTAGDYTVTVTDANGCTDVTSATLNLYPPAVAGIAGTLEICSGTTTMLTASGGTGYAWSTTETTPDISVNTAGDYTVTVTDANGCTDATTVSLIVDPLPTVAISGDLEICSGETSILTASGGTSYAWSTTETTPDISVGTADTYTVLATDANGCTNSATADLIVDPLPTAAIAGDINICAGESTTLTASGGTSYVWSTTETTPDITLNANGNYLVTVTDNNGCTDVASVFLNVNPLPTAAISGALVICTGATTTLTASGGASYEWNTAETTPDISVGTAGNYAVTVTDVNGCTAANAADVSELGYVVTTVADSGPGSLRQTIECAVSVPGLNTITFDIPGGGPFEIKLDSMLPVISDSTIIDASTQPGWSPGYIVVSPVDPATEGLIVTADKCQISGLTLTGFPSYGVLASGNDFALRDCQVNNCTVGVGLSGNARSVVENCVIDHNLAGGIDASTASYAQIVHNSLFCNGGDPLIPATDAPPVPVIDTAKAGVIAGKATYYPLAVKNIVQIFAEGDPSCPGAAIQGKTYIAEADVKPNGTWSFKGDFTPGTHLTTAQTYYLPPAATPQQQEQASTSDFSSSGCVSYALTLNQAICAGEVYNFNGTDYGVTGTYVANLVASDGCDSIVTLKLQVFPVFVEVQQVAICAGDSLIAGGSFQHLPGVYVDTIPKTTTGCDSIIYTVLTVNSLPTVAINAPNTICPGNPVVLAAGNHTYYEWSLNGETTPTITIDSAGAYSVTVTDNNNCSATASVNIVEYCNSVKASFTIDQDTACVAHFVHFTDKSSPNTTSWFWDFGNGNYSQEPSPFDIYPDTGTFLVTLIASDGSGLDTFTSSLFVYPHLEKGFHYAVPDSCRPNYLEFLDSTKSVFPINTWVWNFGDGQPNGSGQNPTHLFGVYDTVNISLTITDIFGCELHFDTLVPVVDFGKKPAPVLLSVSLCENQPYKGVFYQTDTTLVDSLVAVSGCDSIVVTSIYVDHIPNLTAAAGPDETFCQTAGILALSADAPGAGFGTWKALTPGISINNNNNPNTTINNLSEGANILVWSLSYGACVDYSTDTLSITVIPAPADVANAGPDALLCQQPSSTNLAATPPAAPGVKGAWTQSATQALSGVILTDPANPNTLVTGLKPGNAYEFRWTLSTVFCGDFSTDLVEINLTLTPADAGANQQTCPQSQDALLQANLPVGATGQWSAGSGTTAIIESPNMAVTDISGLSAGANTFIWTLSASGCPAYSSDTVVVTAYSGLQAKDDVFFNLGKSDTLHLDVLANDVLPNSPQIRVSPVLPVPEGLRYFGDSSSFTYIFGNTFQPEVTFTYQVCAEDCPGLCDFALVTILSEPPPGVSPALPPVDSITNIITPGTTPGVGDVFKIKDLEKNYPNGVELFIISRWGDVVYHTKNYQNDWDGTNQHGKELPDGTYYYLLRAGVQDDQVRYGPITIVR